MTRLFISARLAFDCCIYVTISIDSRNSIYSRDGSAYSLVRGLSVYLILLLLGSPHNNVALWIIKGRFVWAQQTSMQQLLTVVLIVNKL